MSAGRPNIFGVFSRHFGVFTTRADFCVAERERDSQKIFSTFNNYNRYYPEAVGKKGNTIHPYLLH